MGREGKNTAENQRTKDRVAIVTGASSGIGAAIAVAFGGAGMRVALAARRRELLEQVGTQVRAAGGEVLIVPTDMRQPEAIQALVATTLATWGYLDVLVANAGLGRGGPLEQISEADLLEQVEVNLLGVIRCAQAVLPIMLAQGSGQIIAISSVAGEIAMPTNAVYSATKAAVSALCDGLRREVAGRGIGVTDVLPGFIDTPMTAGQKVPIPMPSADVVARACLHLLQRPRRRVVVPGWYRLLISLQRWFPGLVDWGTTRTLPRYRRPEQGG